MTTTGIAELRAQLIENLRLVAGGGALGGIRLPPPLELPIDPVALLLDDRVRGR